MTFLYTKFHIPVSSYLLVIAASLEVNSFLARLSRCCSTCHKHITGKKVEILPDTCYYTVFQDFILHAASDKPAVCELLLTEENKKTQAMYV